MRSLKRYSAAFATALICIVVVVANSAIAGEDGEKSVFGGRGMIGMGGKDVRIPRLWITDAAQKKDGFTYGPGDYGRKMKFGRDNRFYMVHVPSSYTKTKPVPVVLNFHGGGGHPDGARYSTGMDATSDRHGFILVYPAGTGKLFEDRLLIWNDGRPDKKGNYSKIDDVGFVNALLDDLARFFAVDQKRIYACGISNGAQFTYRLANQLSNRIAAIAVAAGQRTVDQYFPPPPRPIPVMQFSGKEDKIHLYNGGTPPDEAGQVKIDFKFTMKSVEESIQSWIKHDGCPSQPAETKRIGKAVMTRYGPCKTGTEVVLWTLEDGGHTWPGGNLFPSEIKAGVGNVNRDINASEEIWNFLQRHSLD